ncbi:MAG: M48 family metalloprotease [Candidatus Eremiobacteraeota bacterium]|nr:M48 family metalloprotease [Candidatus Eremiobacteraeota bacterium]
MESRNLIIGTVMGAGAAYSIVRGLQAWKALHIAIRARETGSASYGRARRAIAVGGALRSLVGGTAFAFGPLAAHLSRAVAPLPRWSRPAAFLALAVALGALFDLPVEFVEEYTLERSYGLTDQTPNAWFLESFKGIALASGLASLLGLLAGGMLRLTPKRWPVAASIALLPLLVLANLVVPLYVLPLFNSFEPLTGPLEARLRKLASRFGVGGAEILRMDMSRQTKKANAFVTGIGKTHRIVLGDTLIDRFQAAEIEFVVAHELGHYVARDTWRMIAAAEFSAMLLFFIAARGIDLNREDDCVAIARIYAILSAGALLLRPANNWFTRSREWAADRFALAATNDAKAGAAAFARLRDQNRAEDELPSWFEFIFASHPSLGKRIRALEHS